MGWVKPGVVLLYDSLGKTACAGVAGMGGGGKIIEIDGMLGSHVNINRHNDFRKLAVLARSEWSRSFLARPQRLPVLPCTYMSML